ncbi:MAG: sigma factor-like helix-turn-helix DNA-binding protein, partial [Patescibacteria group bacterium]
MSSKKMSAISSFDPDVLSSHFFSALTDREHDILVNRYGLHGSDKATLEEIGKKYAVTRERVRQIENSALNKIRSEFSESVLKDTEQLIRSVLEDHGEIMSEDRLIATLLVAEHDSPKNNALLRFLLNQLLSERLSLERESDHVYKSWSLPGASWDRFHKIIDALIEILREHNEPVPLDALFDKSRSTLEHHVDDPETLEAIVLNYLDVTKKIEENKFNEWGLSDWSSIRPRRMNDKIYLILKREKKPLHFSEIAKKINEANFDARIAYPATIHNELILDEKYVLVGRGIYALKEWGYKPGVVLDVIRDILRDEAQSL